MSNLVGLEEVKQGLRIDHEDHDDLLEGLLIPAASQRILEHMKGSYEATLATGEFDSNEDEFAAVPAVIRYATIMLVGYMLKSPDADPDKEFTGGWLPGPITALLMNWRTPTLA